MKVKLVSGPHGYSHGFGDIFSENNNTNVNEDNLEMNRIAVYQPLLTLALHQDFLTSSLSPKSESEHHVQRQTLISWDAFLVFLRGSNDGDRGNVAGKKTAKIIQILAQCRWKHVYCAKEFLELLVSLIQSYVELNGLSLLRRSTVDETGSSSDSKSDSSCKSAFGFESDDSSNNDYEFLLSSATTAYGSTTVAVPLAPISRRRFPPFSDPRRRAAAVAKKNGGGARRRRLQKRRASKTAAAANASDEDDDALDSVSVRNFAISSAKRPTKPAPAHAPVLTKQQSESAGAEIPSGQTGNNQFSNRNPVYPVSVGSVPSPFGSGGQGSQPPLPQRYHRQRRSTCSGSEAGLFENGNYGSRVLLPQLILEDADGFPASWDLDPAFSAVLGSAAPPDSATPSQLRSGVASSVDLRMYLNSANANALCDLCCLPAGSTIVPTSPDSICSRLAHSKLFSTKKIAIDPRLLDDFSQRLPMFDDRLVENSTKLFVFLVNILNKAVKTLAAASEQSLSGTVKSILSLWAAVPTNISSSPFSKSKAFTILHMSRLVECCILDVVLPRWSQSSWSSEAFVVFIRKLAELVETYSNFLKQQTQESYSDDNNNSSSIALLLQITMQHILVICHSLSWYASSQHTLYGARTQEQTLTFITAVLEELYSCSFHEAVATVAECWDIVGQSKEVSTNPNATAKEALVNQIAAVSLKEILTNQGTMGAVYEALTELSRWILTLRLHFHPQGVMQGPSRKTSFASYLPGAAIKGGTNSTSGLQQLHHLSSLQFDELAEDHEQRTFGAPSAFQAHRDWQYCAGNYCTAILLSILPDVRCQQHMTVLLSALQNATICCCFSTDLLLPVFVRALDNFIKIPVYNIILTVMESLFNREPIEVEFGGTCEHCHAATKCTTSQQHSDLTCFGRFGSVFGTSSFVIDSAALDCADAVTFSLKRAAETSILSLELFICSLKVCLAACSTEARDAVFIFAVLPYVKTVIDRVLSQPAATEFSSDDGHRDSALVCSMRHYAHLSLLFDFCASCLTSEFSYSAIVTEFAEFHEQLFCITETQTALQQLVSTAVAYECRTFSMEKPEKFSAAFSNFSNLNSANLNLNSWTVVSLVFERLISASKLVQTDLSGLLLDEAETFFATAAAMVEFNLRLLKEFPQYKAYFVSKGGKNWSLHILEACLSLVTGKSDASVLANSRCMSRLARLLGAAISSEFEECEVKDQLLSSIRHAFLDEKRRISGSAMCCTVPTVFAVSKVLLECSFEVVAASFNGDVQCSSSLMIKGNGYCEEDSRNSIGHLLVDYALPGSACGFESSGYSTDCEVWDQDWDYANDSNVLLLPTSENMPLTSMKMPTTSTRKIPPMQPSVVRHHVRVPELCALALQFVETCLERSTGEAGCEVARFFCRVFHLIDSDRLRNVSALCNKNIASEMFKTLLSLLKLDAGRLTKGCKVAILNLIFIFLLESPELYVVKTLLQHICNSAVDLDLYLNLLLKLVQDSPRAPLDYIRFVPLRDSKYLRSPTLVQNINESPFHHQTSLTASGGAIIRSRSAGNVPLMSPPQILTAPIPTAPITSRTPLFGISDPIAVNPVQGLNATWGFTSLFSNSLQWKQHQQNQERESGEIGGIQDPFSVAPDAAIALSLPEELSFYSGITVSVWMNIRSNDGGTICAGNLDKNMTTTMFDKVHMLTLGSADLQLTLAVNCNSGNVNIRLSSVGKQLAEKVWPSALVAGQWSNIVIGSRLDQTRVGDTHVGGTAHASVYINGLSFRDVKLGCTYVEQADARAYLLLGNSFEPLRCSGSNSLELASAVVFSGLQLEQEHAMLLNRFGPDCVSLLDTKVRTMEPNLCDYLRPSVLRRDLNVTQLIEEQDGFIEQMQKSLAVVYASSTPERYSIYSLRQKLSSALRQRATPNSGLCLISPTFSYLKKRGNFTAISNAVTLDSVLENLGGASLFLFLFGRVADLSSHEAVQASAFRLLLAGIRRNPTFWRQYLTLYSHNVITTALLVDSMHKSDQMMLELFYAATSLDSNSIGALPADGTIQKFTTEFFLSAFGASHFRRAIIQEPKLLAKVLLHFEMWKKNLPIWLNGLKLVLAMVSPTNVYCHFNCEQLGRAEFLKRMLLLCTETFHEMGKNLPAEFGEVFCGLCQNLLTHPPETGSLTALWDFLFLQHPAACTYLNYKVPEFNDWLRSDLLESVDLAEHQQEILDSNLILRMRQLLDLVGKEELQQLTADRDSSILNVLAAFERAQEVNRVAELATQFEFFESCSSSVMPSAQQSINWVRQALQAESIDTTRGGGIPSFALATSSAPMEMVSVSGDVGTTAYHLPDLIPEIAPQSSSFAAGVSISRSKSPLPNIHSESDSSDQTSSSSGEEGLSNDVKETGHSLSADTAAEFRRRALISTDFEDQKLGELSLAEKLSRDQSELEVRKPSHSPLAEALSREHALLAELKSDSELAPPADQNFITAKEFTTTVENWMVALRAGILDLLVNILTELPQPLFLRLVGSVIKWEHALVMLQHQHHAEIRNNATKLVCCIVQRLDAAQQSRFLKLHGFDLLANHIGEFPPSQAVADHVTSLLIGCSVRAQEEVTDAAVLSVQPDKYHLGVLRCLLVAYTKSLDGGLPVYWNLSHLLEKVILHNYSLAKQLLERRLSEALVSALVSIANMEAKNTDLEGVDMRQAYLEVWETLSSAFVEHCIKYCESLHQQSLLEFLTLIVIADKFTFTNRPASDRILLRSQLCRLLQLCLESIRGFEVAADSPEPVSEFPDSDSGGGGSWKPRQSIVSISALSSAAGLTSTLRRFKSSQSITKLLARQQSDAGSTLSVLSQFGVGGAGKPAEKPRLVTHSAMVERLNLVLQICVDSFVKLEFLECAATQEFFEFLLFFLLSSLKQNQLRQEQEKSFWSGVIWALRDRIIVNFSQIVMHTLYPPVSFRRRATPAQVAEGRQKKNGYVVNYHPLPEYLVQRAIISIQALAYDPNSLSLLRQIIDAVSVNSVGLNLGIHELLFNYAQEMDSFRRQEIEVLFRSLRRLQVKWILEKICQGGIAQLYEDERAWTVYWQLKTIHWQKALSDFASRLKQRHLKLAKTVSEQAMKITCSVVEEQNVPRKLFIQYSKLQAARQLNAEKQWQQLATDLTHVEAVGYDEKSAPKDWSMDFTEGPNRERRRLRPCHLGIKGKFLSQPNENTGIDYHIKSTLAIVDAQEPVDTNQPSQAPLWSILDYFSARSGTDPQLSHAPAIDRLQINEKIGYTVAATIVTPFYETFGELLLSDTSIYFVGEEAKSTQKGIPHRQLITLQWSYPNIVEIYKRWYQLTDTAIELFIDNGETFLVALNSEEKRNEFFQRLLSMDLANLTSYGQNLLQTLTQWWREGSITNFEYLMHLNKIAGRTFSDLMQYPVFPFVLCDYGSDYLDFTNLNIYRTLSKPMAIQDKTVESHYVRVYETLSEEFKKSESEHGYNYMSPHFGPYHFGSHYSNSGIVLHFLVRLPPFTRMLLEYQDDSFDLPDRTFHSLATTWRLSSSESTTDFKELIPEFFFLPEFLTNFGGFKLGERQNGQSVSDVQLPPWIPGNDARLFIRVHRQALESNQITMNLHNWIDLVFGYKQTGKPAIDAINVFHPVTYFGASLEKFGDEVQRNALKTMVRTYGQMPKQLFKTPHLPHLTIKQQICEKSPIPSVLGVKWGNYAGAYGTPEPVLILKQRSPINALPVKLVFLANNSVIGLPKRCALVVTYRAVQRELSMLMQKEVHNTCVLCWDFVDRILRFRLLGATTGPWINLVALHSQHVTVCATAPGLSLFFLGTAHGLVRVYKLDVNKFEKSDQRQCSFVKTLYGHSTSISAITICSEYSILISCADNGDCFLWDLNKLTLVRTLLKQCGRVTICAISPTTGDIATVCNKDSTAGGGSVLIVQTINGRFVASVDTKERLTALCYSKMAEGTSINALVGGTEDGCLLFWDSWVLSLFREIRQIAYCEPIISLGYSHDCLKVYACTSSGTVLCWENPAASKPAKKGHRYTYANPYQ